MGKVRIEKTKNYTVMSNNHFKEKEMSLQAKGLMSMMLSLPDDWDYTVKGLVTLSSNGETATRTALNELERFGYLKRARVYDHGKIVDIDYTLYEEPQRELIDKYNLKQENLNVENLNEENLNQDNQAQLNTNQLNTEPIKDVLNKHTAVAVSVKPSQVMDEFEIIWKAYPRKQGKENAKKSYLKARKAGIEQQTILDGIERYCYYIQAERIEPRFIKQGSTWFNQHCWEDDYTTNRKPTTADIPLNMNDFMDLM